MSATDAVSRDRPARPVAGTQDALRRFRWFRGFRCGTRIQARVRQPNAIVRLRLARPCRPRSASPAPFAPLLSRACRALLRLGRVTDPPRRTLLSPERGRRGVVWNVRGDTLRIRMMRMSQIGSGKSRLALSATLRRATCSLQQHRGEARVMFCADCTRRQSSVAWSSYEVHCLRERDPCVHLRGQLPAGDCEKESTYLFRDPSPVDVAVALRVPLPHLQHEVDDGEDVAALNTL